MLQGFDKKDLVLVYAVIGFGSVALVALGELSAVEPGGGLYNFYLKLVFGGFLVFYAVLFHFAVLGIAKRADKGKNRLMRVIFGERSNRFTIMAIIIGVLFYWITAFTQIMIDTGFRFF